MGKFLLTLATSIFLLVGSNNAIAALLSEDWRNPGDGLITRDTTTGLGWLNLTETIWLSRLDILAQLGSGGDYDGFRYATALEVVELWANFDVDLSAGAPLEAPGLDPGVELASNWLGNLFCGWQCSSYPYGLLGMTDTPRLDIPSYWIMGAFQSIFNPKDHKTIYTPDAAGSWYETTELAYMGHYLVTSSPLPPALEPFPWEIFMPAILHGAKARLLVP